MPRYIGTTRVIDKRFGSTSVKRSYFGTRPFFARQPTTQDMLDAVAAADVLEATLVAGDVPANLLAGSKDAYISFRESNTYLAYCHLGDVYWAELQLSQGGISGGPFSWVQTRILPMYGYVLARGSSGVTYSALWDATYLTSGSPDLYLGGATRQAQHVADNVSIVFTGGGDAWVIFVGRTNGNFVRVQIDGADPTAGSGNELVALSVAGAGFDSYTTTDLKAKQRVKIATGLSNASHTILLTVVTQKNAASAGNRFIFNALAIVSTTRGVPSDTTRDAPLWAAGVVTLSFQQVQWLGNFYFAATAGTTGATPPTHTVGTVTDGAVTWTIMTKSSYAVVDQRLHAAGSEVEYAYQAQPPGQAIEDVGGVLHGNETLVSIQPKVAGVDTALTVGNYINGSSVELAETVTAFHSVSGNISNTVRSHKFEPNKITITPTFNWLQTVSIGWLYFAMWPILHWDALKAKYFATTIQSPEHGSVLPASYYAVVNPIIGKLPELLLAAIGNVFMPDGASGVASVLPATHKCRAWVRTTRTSVNDFATDYDTRAGKAMNISGTTAPGFSSVVAKLYLGRADGTVPTVVNNGDVWAATNVYNITLEAL